jgi:predicted transposase/invertase (TIGR01784 family)
LRGVHINFTTFHCGAGRLCGFKPLRDTATLTGPLVTLMADTLSSPLIQYVIQAGESADAIARELAQRGPQHGDALMTITQHLGQKGIEKGTHLGELRGIEKGEREATLKIAHTMLQNGLDSSPVMKMTRLAENALAQIGH